MVWVWVMGGWFLLVTSLLMAGIGEGANGVQVFTLLMLTLTALLQFHGAILQRHTNRTIGAMERR